MSNTRTVVDVIRADHRARKFLHYIIGFVPWTSSGPGKHNRVSPVFMLDLPQLSRREIDRLEPGYFLEFFIAISPQERLL
jgi:hypothetical protein